MTNQARATHQDISLRCADNIRLLAAAMVEKANSGHPGGPMGGADFIHILYSEFLRYDPSDTHWPLRDRFYLDAGHMSAMLYAQLVLLGHLSLDDIRSFRQWGSATPGHPELNLNRCIENTSGPLGLGHAFGIGSAIAERFVAQRLGEVVSHKTFIYISDGGIQEEISQGTGRIAGHLGLGNVVMFYDANDIQLSTKVGVVMSEDTAKKYEAWGWHVTTIPGNDHDAIRRALREALAETQRPSIIIGKTTMGLGTRRSDGQPLEGAVELHGQPLSKAGADIAKTIEHLGADPANPFVVFPEVETHYQQVREQNIRDARRRKNACKAWAKANPEPAARHKRWLSRQLPALNWDAIALKANDATRNTSGAVLSYLAEQLDNMIVASADLCNSDKTENFLNKTGAFQPHDFSGAFLQVGVSELTMAALATGMALHGDVIPACGTFFAFSDYQKPAIRVCALMEQPVIFIWTHDAFRVGEDGPTHQPVEQEAQIRLLEQLKNRSGRNSFLALRPADGAETVACWKLALENRHSPTGLILTRQNVDDLPLRDASQAARGAYIVQDCEGKPDVVLLANGSEVGALVAGAALLKASHKLKVRVVSAPSEGLFRLQSKKYQRSVLPGNVPVFGLTAGLPVTLQSLAGSRATIWGLNHFGYSAPYKVLNEKFGFTPEQVSQRVVEMLRL